MGNRRKKSRSQKRKFIGNRFTERTKPLDVPTVSEQMLKTTSASFENIPSKDEKCQGIESLMWKFYTVYSVVCVVPPVCQ
ncbi:hypothetical protein TNCV_2021241 [Trichonephila clavipes]|nr:hypothetical protein TNCV_2021241 [Trichonephila clavipes]